MHFLNLETPSVIIDLDIVKRNIEKYQTYCNEKGIKLRPHIKTHKIPEFAKMQLRQGAVGITCQKLSEVEAIISEGEIQDVLVTYNIIGDKKLSKLKDLSFKIDISVVTDNHLCCKGLSDTFLNQSQPLPVLVECDTGAGRCGVSDPIKVCELANFIDQSPGLSFCGLMTYPPVGKVSEVHTFLEKSKKLIEDSGLQVRTISSGGSPDMWVAHKNPVVTEYRVGTYIYNDRSLKERGVCRWNDCAMTVLATVISTPTDKRAVIDAGSKVLTSDLFGLNGYGAILGRSDLKITELYEEHGLIFSDEATGLSVGEKIRVVPNHACVVSNMLDNVFILAGNQILKIEDVVARGKVW